MNTLTVDKPTEKKDPPNTKRFKLIQPQADFIRTEKRYPAYVSAWATGKTLAGIGRAMYLSENYPKNLGMIFRREYVDLRDSTVKDFEEYTGLTVNSEREVKLPNDSTIMFRHLEEMNNIQNVNLGWFWIEQAEEMETDEQFFKLFGRLRRNVGYQSGFITANTNGHNWIYKLWKMNNLEGSVLYEAKTLDNAHNLSKDYIDSLEILKLKRPNIYKRFVENSWEEADVTDIIINPTDVIRAIDKQLNIVPPYKRIVSIDVSRFGDDKTVCYAIENNAMLAKDEWEKKSTMESVGRAVLFAKKHDIKSFAVDEIGVGGGVADRLAELGYQVISVNASERSSGSMYYNRRAEIYQKGSELFANGMVSIDKDDTDLIEQLSWAKYKTVKSNGVYQVEAKEDIKKRYGRSPDNADAFLNGLWALPQAKEVKQMDKYEKSFLNIRSERYGRDVLYV